MLTESQLIRFWSKVKIAGDVDCWEWMGGDDGNGYGKTGIKIYGFCDRRGHKAHRISWMIANRIYLPERINGIRQVVMHTCDNRLCVNPRHLILGTQSQNMKDCFKKSRRLNAKQINMIFCKIQPNKPFWINF